MAPEDSAWQAMPHFCEIGCSIFPCSVCSEARRCMIKIFIGGRGGGWGGDGGGDSSEGCLKWGGGGWEPYISKQGVGKGKGCSYG